MDVKSGLIIDTPAIDRILSGEKTWEMRSERTKKHGLIALIRKGTKTVVGTVEVVDSIGPFTPEEMLLNQRYHLMTPERLADPKVAKWNHAWVLRNARPLSEPIPSGQRDGAVT
ncbi:MAG: ASCH domain-containing protein [Burkholderiales bacterium]